MTRGKTRLEIRSRIELFDKTIFPKRTVYVFILLLIICLLSNNTKAQNLNWAYNITNNQWPISPIGWKIDSQGNTYVAGSFRGDQIYDFDPSAATAFPISGGFNDDDSYDDIFIAKYNSAGQLVWVYGGFTTGPTPYGSDPNLTLTSFDIDDNDNIYLGGYMQGTTGVYFYWNSSQSFITGQSTGTPATDWDGAFLIKINSNGVEQWEVNSIAMATDGTIEDLQYSEALDKVVITGHFSGRHFSSFSTTYNSLYFANKESYLAHVDPSDGSYSNVTHIVQSGGGNQGNNNKPTDLWVDGLGNSYVLGTFSRTADFNPSGSTNSLNPASGGNYLAKYNSSNSYSWAIQNTETLFDIQEKESGNVLVLRGDETYNRVIEEFNSSGSSQGEKFNSTVFQSNFFLTESDQIVYNEDLFSSSTGTYIADFYGFPVPGSDDQIFLKEVNTIGFDFDPSGGIWTVKSDFISREAFVLAKYSNAVDNTAPSYTAFTPLDDTYEVNTNVDLIITFDEPVRPISNSTSLLKKFYVRRSSDNAILDDVNVYSDEVTFSGNQILINLDTELPDNTEMYINFDNGFVIDYAGNQATGVPNFNKTIWNFSTGPNPDMTAPGIQSLLPMNSDSEVEVGVNLSITFDEPVALIPSRLIYVRYVSGGAAVTSFNTSSGNVVLSGNTLTLDPVADLPTDAALYVDIPSNAIEDLSNNAFPGTNASSWAFTTETGDVTPPGILSVVPGNGASNVLIGDNLTLLFNETIQTVPSQNLYIRYVSDNGIFTQLNTSVGSTITISGNQVALNPIPDLPYETALYVDIPSGVFEDLAGNDFVGITTPSWNFTTQNEPDAQAPFVLTYSPADGADNVAVDSDLILTFNEPIVKGGGNIQIHYAGGSLIESIPVTNGNVTISGAELTINPTSDLPFSSDVYVTVSGAAIDDENSNSFAGINNNSTWNFSTADPIDNQPPSISSLFPVDDEKFVALDANLEITFDEPVQTGSGNMQIKNSNGSTKETITISDVSIDGNQVTINPDNDFFLYSEFYILIPDGFFLDMAGNPFPGISDNSTWNFSTRDPDDTNGPIIISLNPGDDDTEIPLDANLVIELDEAVEPVNTSSFIQIRRVSPNTIIETIEFDDPNVLIEDEFITIDPTSDFLPETEYYIYFPSGVLKDFSGNQNTFSLTSNSQWNFTTVDPPPVAISFDPGLGATDVPTYTNLSITFNEPVQLRSGGFFQMFNASNDQQIGTTWSFNGAQFDGNTVYYDIPMDLPGETSIYFIISDGIEDLAGNGFASISPNDWTITTAPQDVSEPMIVTVSPEEGTTDVALDANIVMTFDEPVEPVNQFSFVQIRKAPNSIIENIEFVDDNVTFSGNSVTIDPTNDFEAGTDYFIYLPTGVLQDLSGNSNTFSSTNIDDWNFTTAAPALAITSVSPDFNSSNGHVLTLDVYFNRNIQLVGNDSDWIIRLFRYSDDQPGAFAKIENAIVDGNHLEMLLEWDPLDNEEVYVSFIPGRIQDLEGNDFEIPVSKDHWKFTSDWDYVERTALQPENFSIKNVIDGDIKITYDQNIQKGQNGSYTLRKWTGSEVILSFTMDDPRVSIVDDEVFFDVDDLLEYNTRYFITALGVPIRGVNGEPTRAFNNNVTFVFTIEPDPALFAQPIAFTPNHQSTGISVDTDLTIEFSNPVTFGGSIFIYNINTGSQIGSSISTTVDATIDGNIVTIPTNQTLPYETEIAVRVSESAFISENHGVFEITDNDTWYFTTEDAPDTESPTISTLSPTDGAANVPIDASFTLTLNENVQKGIGNIEVRRISDEGVETSVSVNSGSVIVTNNEVSFSFPDDLNFSTDYWIYMDQGAIEDIAGNDFGITSDATWQFTAEPPPLAISSVSPDFNSSNGHVLTLDIHFNRDIQLVGNATDWIVRLFRRSDDQAGAFASIGNATVDGNHLEMLLEWDPLDNEEVYVSFFPGVIQDTEGNDFNIPTSKDYWKFTSDWDYVERTALQPENFSIKNAIDGDIKITYDQNIQKGQNGSYTLRKWTGSEVILSFDMNDPRVSVSGNDVFFDVDDLLEYNTRYFITALGVPIRGVNGEPTRAFNDNVTFVFTIEPDPALFAQPIAFTPGHQSTGIPVDTDLSIEFSNPVTFGGSIFIYNRNTGSQIGSSVSTAADASIDGNIVTIPTNQILPYETEIAIRVSESAFISEDHGVFEITDNDTWFFTTEEAPDITAPMVNSVTPTDDADNVATDEALIVTFNEDIMLGMNGATKQAVIRNNSTVFEVIPLTPANINGNQLTMPHSDFEESTEYHVLLADGVIADLANNWFPGYTTSDDWNFTTGDFTGPTITSLDPDDDATNVSLDQNLILTFNEPVQSTGGGVFSLFNKSTGEQIGPNWFFPAGATFDGNTVTYDIPITLPYETEVYINIANAIEDEAGNNASNINDNESWTFTTIENSDPTDITLTNNTVDENASIGLIIGTLNAVDPNGSDTHTFELVSGEGDDNNDGFLVDNAFLKSNTVFDFETQNPLSIRVRTTDNYNNFHEKILSIVINDVFEDPGNTDPTDISITSITIQENEPIGTVIGQFTTSDADGGDTHVYSLVSGTGSDDNGSFDIDDDELTSLESFDFESKSSYSIRVRTTDNNGGTYEEQFTIAIEDVLEIIPNQAPTDLEISSQSIAENETIGTVVGSFQTTDPDADDVHTYSLVSGEGDDDNAVFEIDDNELVTNQVLDYEVQNSFSIRIRTTDEQGAFFEKSIAILVEDVEERVAQTITFNTISDQVFGGSLNLTASSDSDLEVSYDSISGPIIIEGNTVSFVGTGNAIIRAYQDGDDNYFAADSVEVSFVINKADQTISIDSISDKNSTDDPFMASASVSSGLSLTYRVSGPATISEQTITLSGDIGTVSLIVEQVGNTNYNPTIDSITFTVSGPEKSNQEITFNELTPITFGTEFIVLSASSNSGLTVDFTLLDGPGSINGDTVVITGAGVINVRATQAGNDTLNAAQAVDRSIIVNKADQILTVLAIEDKLLSDGPIEIQASVNTNLPLSYSIDGPATIASNVITLIGIGTVTITVSQVGDDNYNPISGTVSFEVNEEIVSGLEDNWVNEVLVYPNPGNGLFNITRTNRSIRVVVSDLRGQALKTIELDSNNSLLDLTQLSSGVYLLRGSDGKDVFVKRIQIR